MAPQDDEIPSIGPLSEPPAVTASLIEKHAPGGWADLLPLEAIREHVQDGIPLQMIVLCADIRKSTLLMRESTDPRHFAAEISGFVNEGKRGIRSHGGWFDKFTGDGFLAYWLCVGPETWDTRLPQVLSSCFTLIEALDARLDRLRPSLQNLPDGTGLSCGVDIGPTSLAVVADELTVLGPAVVGAVRMVGAANQPRETLINVGLGARLYGNRESLGNRYGFDVRRELRPTKEYASQEVYSLAPRGNWKALLCDWADPHHHHGHSREPEAAQVGSEATIYRPARRATDRR